jgi:plasmid stability protein
VSYQDGSVTFAKDAPTVDPTIVTRYSDTAALKDLGSNDKAINAESYSGSLSIECKSAMDPQQPQVLAACMARTLDTRLQHLKSHAKSTCLYLPDPVTAQRVAAAVRHLIALDGLVRGAVATNSTAPVENHANEPLPDIVATLNAAVRQKIVFSNDDLARATVRDSSFTARLVKDANINDYADHGGGIRGAPAASNLATDAESIFGLTDARVELAYQRACALPYNEAEYTNFCAKLGNFYEKRGDFRMALAVFTMAPKCAHETHVNARMGPPCMTQAAVMYSRTGDENSATRLYGELCSSYAVCCEEFNSRGGHANLAASRSQWEANVQGEKDQRRQDQEDRAERAQASDARFNTVLGTLQGLPGGNDPNAILNAGNQQAAAMREIGDANGARQQQDTQMRLASQRATLKTTSQGTKPVVEPATTYQRPAQLAASSTGAPASVSSPSVSGVSNTSVGSGAIQYSTPLATSCVRQRQIKNTCLISMLASGHQLRYYADIRSFWGSVMAQLIVRDLPAELVLALKRRAAKRNRSAEQEHREILKAALTGTKRRPLAAVLAAIPNVGEDSDFRREQSDRR